MKRNPTYWFALFLLAHSVAMSQDGDSRISPGKLQALIDKASVGESLVISPGIYTGNILISKRIKLRGMAGAVIRGDGVRSCITITADSCVIEGFTVENSGKMLVDEDAGILIKSSHNTIQHNELRDVLFGIYLYHADSNTIAHNHIVGMQELELGERGSGIHVWNSQYNTLLGNTISQARDGFYIQNANHTLVIGNEVSNLRYGLHYMYADSNQFVGNRFHDNVAGAAIMYSTGIVMRRNEFINNRGFASYGILFQDCHGMIADSNTIVDNVTGLFFEASTDNLFRHNIIARNDVALEMFQNSVGNTFTENNFIDNLSPLTIVGKRTESLWNHKGIGNYWSNYDGYDLDGDGVGDIPMKIQNIFNYLEGTYPNVRLYLYSPASQALAFAAKAFPIVSINQEADAFPLMRPVPLRLGAVKQDNIAGTSSITSAPKSGNGWVGLSVVAICLGGLFITRFSKRGVQWSR